VLDDLRLRIERRKDDRRRLRDALRDLAQRVDTAALGHVGVDDRDVGALALRRLDGLRRVGRRGRQLQAGLAVDHLGQQIADIVLVVRNQHPDRC
jgi:hypothetical protein